MLAVETALQIDIVGEDRDAMSSNAFATKGVDDRSHGDWGYLLTEQGICQPWAVARNRTADKASSVRTAM